MPLVKKRARAFDVSGTCLKLTCKKILLLLRHAKYKSATCTIKLYLGWQIILYQNLACFVLQKGINQWSSQWYNSDYSINCCGQKSFISTWNHWLLSAIFRIFLVTFSPFLTEQKIKIAVSCCLQIRTMAGEAVVHLNGVKELGNLLGYLQLTGLTIDKKTIFGLNEVNFCTITINYWCHLFNIISCSQTKRCVFVA